MFMGDRWSYPHQALSRHICMDAFTSGWNKKYPSLNIAGMGHQEAKTDGRSEQREKVVQGHEVQSKRRVGDSVQKELMLLLLEKQTLMADMPK